MAGTDTIRGIAFQQAQALLILLDGLLSLQMQYVRVEAQDDIVDIELLDESSSRYFAAQIKIRDDKYTWGQSELIDIFNTWYRTSPPVGVRFEFITDGRLGPTGQKILDELSLAKAGDSRPLEKTLTQARRGIDMASIASSLWIRIDPSPIGALLTRAESMVRSMLIADASDDANADSVTRVDALYRELFTAAAESDVNDRLMSRAQILSILSVDEPALRKPWSEIRWAYLENAPKDAGPTIGARLRSQGRRQMASGLGFFDSAADDKSVDLSTLVSRSDVMVVIGGSTGTGKTTCARQIEQIARVNQRPTFSLQAEGYFPGKLDALLGAAASDRMGIPIPTSTVAEILRDPTAIVVIDGVTEIPGSLQHALKDDLRAALSRVSHPQFVLIGRSVTVARSLLPVNVSMEVYQLHPLNQEERLQVIGLSLQKGSTYAGRPSDALRTIEAILGDAASNPLLLTMVCSVLGVDDTAFASRSDLYEGFVDHLAWRSGVTGMRQVAVALGQVFNKLLDTGRRYADPYEWHQLIADLPPLPGLPSINLHDAAMSAGLIVLSGLGERVVPIHDSFADYLAGLALGRGAANLPSLATDNDEQRLTFAAEIGGVSEGLSVLVARHIPFTAIAVGRSDLRPLSKEGLAEIAVCVEALTPGLANCGCSIFAIQNHLIMTHNESARFEMPGVGVVDENILLEGPWVELVGGPLSVATMCWREHVKTALRPAEQRQLGFPRTADPRQEYESSLEHDKKVAEATRQLIDAICPPTYVEQLTRQLAPLRRQSLEELERELADPESLPRRRDHPRSVAVRRVVSVLRELSPPGWWA